MLVVALCCYFALPASAASGLASTQHVATDVPGVAAIAEAVPPNIFADVFKPSEDEPTTKSARGQIDESSHASDSTTSRVTNLTLAAGATLGFSEIVASEACIQRGTCYEANRLLPDGTTKVATLGRSLIKGAGTSAAILALAKLKRRHPKWALVGSIGLVAWNGYLTKRALDRFPE